MKLVKTQVKSPINFLSKAKIKTFRKLDRKGSIIYLIKDAKALKNNLNDLSEKNSSLTSSNNINSSKSSLPKSVKKLKQNLKLINNINKQINHKYKQSKLPILTSSQQILTEAELVNNRDKYYKKNLSNKTNNFGRKFVIHNLAYKSFDTKNEEEFIQLMGLNDEEKDPLKVIQGKKYDYNMQYERGSLKKNNFKFLRLQTTQHKSESKNIFEKSKKTKNIVDLKQHIFISSRDDIYKKNTEIFSFAKKDDFSDFLINNYIKNNFPKLLDNSNNIVNNFSITSDKNNNRRKIFVVKNSTIIYNHKTIPGFLLEIPTDKEMNTYSSTKRKFIMSQFYEFITRKFQSKQKLNYIFKKNRNIIQDFGYLTEHEKYIYVSSKSTFEGLLFPYNKNLINIYIKHFREKERDKYYFNESSFDKSYTEKDESKINNDDIYDIYFTNKNKIPQKKNFKKIKKTKNLNTSFTFGIDSEEKENYDYIYYSDNENRKKKFDEYNNDLFHKNPNNNLNFYIEAQNQIYDTHIKSLISQLSSNKNKKNYFSYKKYHKPKDELIKDYLTEKKMPQKNILKQNTTKELAYQAIIDTFNLLQTQDKTIDKNKFIKARKNSPLYLPYVEENIKTNTSKYYFSRRKLDKEYPSILSYNFPKVVEIQKKYLLNDLIKYYTKFKSLLNLWLNMHPLADVSQYGIDFDTFFSCTEEICEEEEIFVKKIFDRINTETSGILSLEDYVDGLIALNRDVLTDQIEFFLKVFNSKNKTYFNYKEIFDISKLSIKRLIKIKNKYVVETVSDDLGGYLADFIFKLCDSKPEKGIEIKKLKDVLENDKEHGEFLKLFMCFFGDNKYEDKIYHINTINNIINKEKYLKKYRESIRLSFESHMNNLKYQ